LYLSGGLTIEKGTTKKQVVNTFERMKVNSGNWETLPTFETARFGHFSWADKKNNKIYIACGASDPRSPQPIDSIEVFDANSNSWSKHPSKHFIQFQN
jgi:N-acetylneuraminic acid mutarotase